MEVIRVIYDRYIHTNEGVAGVAKYLNRNGYTKKLRQNNTIPGFFKRFCEKCIVQSCLYGKDCLRQTKNRKETGYKKRDARG